MGIDFGRLSVLVVEDQETMLEINKACLEALGFGEVHTALNGEEAFEIFCTKNPDIVMTDWTMKPIDGLELTQLIRRDFRSPNRLVPIIMLTGHSSISRVREATKAGINDYIVKPYTVKDLATRLGRLINFPKDFVESDEYVGPVRGDTC